MRAIFFSCLSLLVLSCNKGKNADCQSEQYNYHFKNDSQVDTVRNPSAALFATITPGNKIVFNYEYSSMVCDNVVDAGFADNLVFEVPAGATGFEYDQAAELETAKAYFVRACFCGNVSSRLVSGSIKGTRLNNSQWSVQANVTEPVTGVSLSFNKTFQLE